MRHWLLGFVFLLSGTVSATEQSDKKEQEVEPKTLAELATAMESKAKELKIPGFQATIYNADGIEWTHNYGFTDEAKQKPVKPDTLFRAGSTTKTFVAMAVLQLANQGNFNLNDNLRDVAPEVAFENPWETTHPVKVIHMLEHTAGFDDMHFKNLYNFDEPNISLIDAINRDKATLVSRWKPGTRSSYSNPGYGIAGFIIEKYSGMSYEQYVTEQILQPLKMQQSDLNRSAAVLQHISDGFEMGKPAELRDIYLRSAGALYTTTAELAQLGQFLLSRAASHQISNINQDDVIEMESQQSTLSAPFNLSGRYGMAIGAFSESNVQWHGHTGGIAGFLTAYAYAPALNKGYSFMMSTSTSSMSQMTKIIRQFIAKDVEAHQAKGVKITNTEIDGYYRMSSDRNQIARGFTFVLGGLNVYTDGDTLTVDPIFGSKETYIHLGKDLFAEEGNQNPLGVFIQSEEHGTVMDIDGVYIEKVSALSVWLPIIIIGFGSLGLVISVFYFPVWVINGLRGQYQPRKRFAMRVLPFAALVSLFATVIAFSNVKIEQLAMVNWQTITIMLSTYAFAIFSWASCWMFFTTKSLETSTFVKWFNGSIVIGYSILAIYLAYWGFIGLRIWAY